jgi:pilus assembly protein Flp/PilA
MIRHFLRNQSGATAIEYAIIAALLSIAIIGGVSLVGDSLDENYSETASRVAQTVN